MDAIPCFHIQCHHLSPAQDLNENLHGRLQQARVAESKQASNGLQARLLPMILCFVVFAQGGETMGDDGDDGDGADY